MRIYPTYIISSDTGRIPGAAETLEYSTPLPLINTVLFHWCCRNTDNRYFGNNVRVRLCA